MRGCEKMCTFAKISKKTIDDYWEARFLHDAINKAINKAKTLGFTEENCQPLIIEKLKIAKDYKDCTQEMIDSCISSNIIRINEDWYGIICMAGKKPTMIVYPLHQERINEIYVDFSFDKAKSREDYTQFVKDNMNHEVLNDYKNKVFRKQDEILNKFFNCTDHLDKNGKTFLITSHCIQRWDERIEKGDGRFQNEKRAEIVNRLMKSFKNAKFVYTSDSIGSNFYLDKNNMIFYAVSDDNIILTLWKNEYGFSDTKINNITTMLQLEYIKGCQNKLEKLRKKYDKVISSKEQEKEILLTNIELVNKKIEELLKQKEDLTAQKKALSDNIIQDKNVVFEHERKLKYEESLIFKNHKMVGECEKEM